MYNYTSNNQNPYKGFTCVWDKAPYVYITLYLTSMGLHYMEICEALKT